MISLVTKTNNCNLIWNQKNFIYLQKYHLEGRVISITTINTENNPYSGHSNPAYGIPTQPNPSVTINAGYSTQNQQYGSPDYIYNPQAYHSSPQQNLHYNTTVEAHDSVWGQPPMYKA